jgi:hypothetical protein
LLENTSFGTNFNELAGAVNVKLGEDGLEINQSYYISSLTDLLSYEDNIYIS